MTDLKENLWPPLLALFLIVGVWTVLMVVLSL